MARGAEKGPLSRTDCGRGLAFIPCTATTPHAPRTPPYRPGSSHPRPALARTLFSYPAPHLPSCPRARRPFLALPRRGDQLTRLTPHPTFTAALAYTCTHPAEPLPPLPRGNPPAASRHLSKSPTFRLPNKSESRQVGKLASPRLTRPRRPALYLPPLQNLFPLPAGKPRNHQPLPPSSPAPPRVSFRFITPWPATAHPHRLHQPPLCARRLTPPVNHHTCTYLLISAITTST